MFGIRRVGMTPNQRLIPLTRTSELRNGLASADASSWICATTPKSSQYRFVQTAARRMAKAEPTIRGSAGDRAKGSLASVAPVLHNAVRSQVLKSQSPKATPHKQPAKKDQSGTTRSISAEPHTFLGAEMSSTVDCLVAASPSAPTGHPTEAVIVTVLDCLTALMKRNNEQSAELLQVLAQGNLMNIEGTPVTMDIEEEDDDVDVDDDDNDVGPVGHVHRVEGKGAPSPTSAVVVKDLRTGSFEAAAAVPPPGGGGGGSAQFSNNRRRELLANTWPTWLELAAEPFSMCDVTPESDFVLNALAVGNATSTSNSSTSSSSNGALVPSSMQRPRSYANQNQNQNQNHHGNLGGLSPSFSSSNALDCENEQRPLLFEEAWMLRLLAPAFAGDGIVLAAKDAPAAILAVTLRPTPSSSAEPVEQQELQEPLFFYSSSSNSLTSRPSGSPPEESKPTDLAAPSEPHTEEDSATLSVGSEAGEDDDDVTTSTESQQRQQRKNLQKGHRAWWKAGKPFVRHTLEYFDPICGKFVSVQIPFSPPERKALDSRILVSGATVLAKTRGGNEKTDDLRRLRNNGRDERTRSPELEALLKSPPPDDLFGFNEEAQQVERPPPAAEGGQKLGLSAIEEDETVISV